MGRGAWWAIVHRVIKSWTCLKWLSMHSNRCVVILCGFDLHFPDDYWCFIFHVPVGHLNVFFGKMSIQIFCSFLNQIFVCLLLLSVGFPCGSDGKESVCSAEDPGLIPGSGRSPGKGKGYPLQYSCLENSMDRGAMGSQRVRHNWVANTLTFQLFLWIFNFIA